MDLNQVKKAYKLKRYPVDPENLGPIVTGESPMIIIGFLTTFKVTSHLSGAPAAQQRGLEGSNLTL